MEDRCICCGEIIPEGRQVCWTCEKGEVNSGNNRMHISCDCSSRIYGNCMGGKRRVGGQQMIKNGSGIPDPVLTQAMWGIRQEEKTRELEKRHGVYRGEYYQVLVERTSEDARTYKTVKEYRKMKVIGVYPNIVTLKDKSGIVESFRWNDFYKKRK